MKRVLITALLLSIQSPVFAIDASDLAPTERELDRATERAEQERGQRELERKQERERARSEAERRIDKIPKETTVNPTFRDGGGVIEVIIPNK